VGENMEYLIFTDFQLAKSLKNRRIELKLTQKAVAEKVGLLPKTVSALENNPEKCSVESLMKYLSALDLHIVLKAKNSNVTEGW